MPVFNVPALLCFLQPDGTHLSFHSDRPRRQWEEYLDAMAKSGTWGSVGELQALSSMLGFPICVITDYPSTTEFMYWLYPGRSVERRHDKVIVVAFQRNHFYSLGLSGNEVVLG